LKTVTTAIYCELRKIFWRPKYWIILAAYAAIGLGAGMIGASGYSLRAIAEFTYTVTGPNVVFGALSVYRTFLIPLAIFMLSADMLTHEIESKSIKCIIVRPVSRFDIYLAKCLSIFIYIAIALGVGFLSVSVWQTVSAGLAGSSLSAAPGAVIDGLQARNAGPRSAGAVSLSYQINLIAEAFVSYALTLIPMAAYIAYAAFIAVLIRSPALVMFLCIISYLAFAFFGTFFNFAGAALFTTYTSWYRMWLGERLPWRSLITTAGLLLSTCVVFFGFGYFIFDKKEI